MLKAERGKDAVSKGSTLISNDSTTANQPWSKTLRTSPLSCRALPELPSADGCRDLARARIPAPELASV